MKPPLWFSLSSESGSQVNSVFLDWKVVALEKWARGWTFKNVYNWRDIWNLGGGAGILPVVKLVMLSLLWSLMLPETEKDILELEV